MTADFLEELEELFRELGLCNGPGFAFPNGYKAVSSREGKHGMAGRPWLRLWSIEASPVSHLRELRSLLRVVGNESI